MPRFNIQQPRGEAGGKLAKLAALQQITGDGQDNTEGVLNQMRQIYGFTDMAQRQELAQQELGLRRDQFESQRSMLPLQQQMLEADLAAKQHANAWLQPESEQQFNARDLANQGAQQRIGQQEKLFPLSMQQLELQNAGMASENAWRQPFAEQKFNLGQGELDMQPGRRETQDLQNQGLRDENAWRNPMNELKYAGMNLQNEGQGLNNTAQGMQNDYYPWLQEQRLAIGQGEIDRMPLQQEHLNLQNEGLTIGNLGAQTQLDWMTPQLRQSYLANEAKIRGMNQDLPPQYQYLPDDIRKYLENQAFPEVGAQRADAERAAELQNQELIRQDKANDGKPTPSQFGGRPYRSLNAVKNLFNW